jgi:hypothetical protein
MVSGVIPAAPLDPGEVAPAAAPFGASFMLPRSADLTNRQDWAACESVQRGMSTPSYQPGPLAPNEDGVYDFSSLTAKLYAGTN